MPKKSVFKHQFHTLNKIKTGVKASRVYIVDKTTTQPSKFFICSEALRLSSPAVHRARRTHNNRSHQIMNTK
jgi:hypothetical protein